MERKDSIKIRVTKKEVIERDYNIYNKIAPDLIMVHDYKKYGIIDIEGNIVVPCKYSDIYSFSEDLAIVGKNGLYGYINKKGEEVIPCKYFGARNFSEGLAAVFSRSRDGEGYLWGYINKKGEEVIPCEYEKAGFFSEGLAAVQKDKLKGYINKNGIEVIPCEYEEALNFNGGIAIVKEKEQLWYCIDKMGEIIMDSHMIKYNRKFTEELYIKNEKEIPDDCTDIEMISYKSLFVLNNGDRIEIEAPTREEWENEIKKVTEEEMTHLENRIKSTSLTKKLTK